MDTNGDNPFPVEALSANQDGRLTDAQLQAMRTRAGARRLWAEIIGAFFIFIAVLLFIVVGQGRSGVESLLLGIGMLAAGAGLIGWGLSGRDALTRDLKRGRVEHIEGAILPHASHSYSGNQGGTSAVYSLRVGGQEFSVDEEQYQAAPHAGHVRLFFLPKSHVVVNLEPLPDRPTPDGVAPQQLAMNVVKGYFSGDWVTQAEANAAMAAYANGPGREMFSPQLPPSPEQRDPRPLGEAIVGTWSNGLLTMSFLSDGSLVVPGSRHHGGRWSVDGEGKLHADLAGHGVVADAWVSDDQLTVAAKEDPITLRRVTAPQS